MNKDQAAHYLAAMIDGEGYVPELATSHRYRSIRIANTDPDLIAAMHECCDLLGLRYLTIPLKSKNPRWADGWAVDINGYESLCTVRDFVPIRCKRKLERLNGLIDSYKFPPLDRADVETAYVKGETVQSIAARLGCSKSRVTRSLRSYGVEIRPRGGSRKR